MMRTALILLLPLAVTVPALAGGWSEDRARGALASCSGSVAECVRLVERDCAENGGSDCARVTARAAGALMQMRYAEVLLQAERMVEPDGMVAGPLVTRLVDTRASHDAARTAGCGNDYTCHATSDLRFARELEQVVQ